MSFWGAKVAPGAEAKIGPKDDAVLHLSQACLDPSAPSGSSARVVIEKSGSAFVVACLKEGTHDSCALDLFLDTASDKVKVTGTATCHLTGYFEDMDLDSAEEDLEPPAQVAKKSQQKAAEKSSESKATTVDKQVEAKTAAAINTPTPTAAQKPAEGEDDEEEEEESEAEAAEEPAAPAKVAVPEMAEVVEKKTETQPEECDEEEEEEEEMAEESEEGAEPPTAKTASDSQASVPEKSKTVEKAAPVAEAEEEEEEEEEEDLEESDGGDYIKGQGNPRRHQKGREQGWSG